MLYIGINTLFNGFILGLVLLMGNEFTHTKILTTEECLLVGYAISAMLTVIGYTKLAGNIVGIFIAGSKPIDREIQRIQPLLSDVINRTNKYFNTNYKYTDFKIRITDNVEINAFALGYNTITINKGALNGLTDGQLMAILGHELGHLYYRDSVRSMALIFGSFGAKVFMWCYTIVTILQAVITNLFKATKTGGLASFVALLPMLMLLPIVILNWVGSWVFCILNLGMSRKAEYRADAFTAILGYKLEMIEALEIFSNISIADNSFISKLMSTHPSPMQRIGALEDKEIRQQYFGTFNVETELVHNGVNTNNGKELGLLSIYLLLLGGFCFGYMNYNNIKNTSENLLEYKNNIRVDTINTPSNSIHKHGSITNHHKNNQVHKLRTKSIQKETDTVHIINQYKVSDNKYTITYNYKGKEGIKIVNNSVTISEMTINQLNTLK